MCEDEAGDEAVVLQTEQRALLVQVRRVRHVLQRRHDQLDQPVGHTPVPDASVFEHRQFSVNKGVGPSHPSHEISNPRKDTCCVGSAVSPCVK